MLTPHTVRSICYCGLSCALQSPAEITLPPTAARPPTSAAGRPLQCTPQKKREL